MRTISARRMSKMTMPSLTPECIADWIWCVLPSRMRLRTAPLAIRTSDTQRTPTLDERNQALGDDALEGSGELVADLCLLVRREGVDDALYGLCRAVGVQGREDQVTRSLRRLPSPRLSPDRASRR